MTAYRILSLDGGGGQKREDVRLLSVSTGTNPRFVEGRQLDWGYAQWLPHLVGIMIEGAMGVPDYQCARLLGDHYHRLDPELPCEIGLDDWHRADDLISLARQVPLEDTIQWFQDYF